MLETQLHAHLNEIQANPWKILLRVFADEAECIENNAHLSPGETWGREIRITCNYQNLGRDWESINLHETEDTGKFKK